MILFDAGVQLAAVLVLEDEGLEDGAERGHSIRSLRSGLRIARINTPKALTPAPVALSASALSICHRSCVTVTLPTPRPTCQRYFRRAELR
jgi:hypothetical protein